MRVYHQSLTVSFDYPVYFGTDLLRPDRTELAQAIARKEPHRRHRLCVVLEERVAALWPTLAAEVEAYVAAHAGRLELAAAPIRIVGGEASKNDPGLVVELLRQFERLGLDRQSFVVIVGGGALQDVVGYAAAIAHRGLRVVRLPTTVLSQNDSGVGVKNGVNEFGKKNFVGTFAPPFAVLDDFRFLDTLDERDRVAGMAEAVKVALVKDPEFFLWLEANAPALRRFEPDVVSRMIERCAVLHLQHIAGRDPFELGSSRPLDFGHWAAHKMEALSNHALRHGEAVAVGIALDTYYSEATGLLSARESSRVVALLDALGLPHYHPSLDERLPSGRRSVIQGLDEFREHLGGELTVMMLEQIGRGREVHCVEEDVVAASIERLRCLEFGAQEPERPLCRAGGDG